MYCQVTHLVLGCRGSSYSQKLPNAISFRYISRERELAFLHSVLLYALNHSVVVQRDVQTEIRSRASYFRLPQPISLGRDSNRDFLATKRLLVIDSFDV